MSIRRLTCFDGKGKEILDVRGAMSVLTRNWCAGISVLASWEAREGKKGVEGESVAAQSKRFE